MHLVVDHVRIIKIKYEIPSYIGSLTTVVVLIRVINSYACFFLVLKIATPWFLYVHISRHR